MDGKKLLPLDFFQLAGLLGHPCALTVASLHLGLAKTLGQSKQLFHTAPSCLWTPQVPDFWHWHILGL